MELAQQIYSIIEQSFDVQGQLGLKISSSIGVALYPDHPSSHTQLMKLADNVMYKVKNSGRNTVQFSQVRL